MGNRCTPNPAQQATTPENPHQQQIVNQITPVMGLDHPANINNKYQHIQKVIPNQYVGQGIKKTNAYKSLISQNELIKKREEYFETMTSGSQECWLALKKSLELKEQEAFTLLASAGLKLVNKSLQMSYDETGYKYEIPIFCINDPSSFEAIRQVNFIKKQLSIVIRSSKTTTDEKMTVSNDIRIGELKRLYLMSINLEGHRVRLIMNGKELANEQPLGFYEVGEQQLLQAFLIKE